MQCCESYGSHYMQIKFPSLFTPNHPLRDADWIEASRKNQWCTMGEPLYFLRTRSLFSSCWHSRSSPTNQSTPFTLVILHARPCWRFDMQKRLEKPGEVHEIVFSIYDFPKVHSAAMFGQDDCRSILYMMHVFILMCWKCQGGLGAL